MVLGQALSFSQPVSSGVYNNILSIDLPVGPNSFTIYVHALQDNVEPGGTNESASENVTFAWAANQSFVGVNLTGSGAVTISDELESVNFSTETARTSELGPPPGVFVVKPANVADTLCTTIVWEVNSNDSDSQALYRAILDQDYTLTDDDPNPLTFTETPAGSGIYRSNDRTVSHDGDFRLYVHAIDDHILEGEETVGVKVIVPAINYTSSEQTVTITEDYVDARSQKDEASTCPCKCTTCGDGVATDSEAASGDTHTYAAGGDVEVRTSGQGGSSPVIEVGLTLPDNKTVPTSISVQLQVVQPDLRSDDSKKALVESLFPTIL